MGQNKYKISFCTVCMNRLHHLKQTLIQNIKDNEDYEQAEFVLLDYNSQDGMEEWVRDNLSNYILNGKLIYYKTTDPQLWNPSHSKNLAFKLASGDILCNIWADYFIGRGFAKHINNLFQRNSAIVLTPIDFHGVKINYNPPGDVLGKVCVKKEDFLRIDGFDEKMDKHGFEDYDFVNRLEMINVKRILIVDLSYLKFIPHENYERYQLPMSQIHSVFLSHNTPYASVILFLYHNGHYERGTLMANFFFAADDYTYAYLPRKDLFEYSLLEREWETGKWKMSNDYIYLSPSLSNKSFVDNKEANHFLIDLNNQQSDCRITDIEMIESMLKFRHFLSTRSIMEDNLKNKRAAVNSGIFGKGTVHKNFQRNCAITIS